MVFLTLPNATKYHKYRRHSFDTGYLRLQKKELVMPHVSLFDLKWIGGQAVASSGIKVSGIYSDRDDKELMIKSSEISA